jgi:hypothetical protein|tara:strand:+ start:53515 stop:53997 length:483 start_codon:yes stop_codon:yes gene_type:complete
MKYFLILSTLIICTSCQFFETEKISSETFYDEEVKTINWKDVDRYPAFAACDTLSTKPNQKHCFEEALAAHLQQGITAQGVTTIKELNDTIMLSFSVSEKAQISILQMQMDSLLQKDFPHLQDSLHYSLEALQLVAPAYKRGIPVKTQFMLPIIVKSVEE